MPAYILSFVISMHFIAGSPSAAFTQLLDEQENADQQKVYRVMFYNIENLFDTYDDPLTQDDEFTPNGPKSWSNFRYEKKLLDLSKVIIASGEWSAPDIIGLCEIENFQVLLDLINKTPLKSFNYQIIHENSPDTRGIDVAMLYRPQFIKKISHKAIRIGPESAWKTRDILASTLVLNAADTIHFFVNHWPSRIGGKEKTEAKRVMVARTLRHQIDSIFSMNERSKIVVMGDFNDEARDKSMLEILNANPLNDIPYGNQLYNLSFPDLKAGLGTLVFKEINHTWFLFDQIIVSGTLINHTGITVKNRKSTIFNQPWLLRNGRPYRTYQGPIYKGGFSDHLPVFIDLYLQQ
jgi:endonuclease/exonuclease/phosphatase family metal-dependent hydrolase